MFHLPLLYQPALLVNFLFLVKKSYAAYVRWSEIPMFAGAFSARGRYTDGKKDCPDWWACLKWGLILSDFSKLEIFWVFLGLLLKKTFEWWECSSHDTHTPRVWWWTSNFLDGFSRVIWTCMLWWVLRGFDGFSLKHPHALVRFLSRDFLRTHSRWLRIEWPGEEDFGGYIAYASFSKATSGPCTDRNARMEALEWGSCATK